MIETIEYTLDGCQESCRSKCKQFNIMRFDKSVSAREREREKEMLNAGNDSD